MPDAPSYVDIFKRGFINLGLGFVGGVALILALMRYFPKTRLGSALILQDSINSGAALEMATTGEAAVSYIGWQGESTTDLRPAGKGRFQGKQLDIISDGEFIPKDTPIEVIKHEGSRIVVKKK